MAQCERLIYLNLLNENCIIVTKVENITQLILLMTGEYKADSQQCLQNSLRWCSTQLSMIFFPDFACWALPVLTGTIFCDPHPFLVVGQCTKKLYFSALNMSWPSILVFLLEFLSRHPCVCNAKSLWQTLTLTNIMGYIFHWAMHLVWLRSSDVKCCSQVTIPTQTKVTQPVLFTHLFQAQS